MLGEGSDQSSTQVKPKPRVTRNSISAGLVPPLDFSRPTKASKNKVSPAERAREEASASTVQRQSAYRELISEIAVRKASLEPSSSTPLTTDSSAGNNAPVTPVASTSGTTNPPIVTPPVVPVTPVVPVAPVVITPPVTNTKKMATSSFKVPSPWDSRNCPSFDGKTAESLMKYLRFSKLIIEGAGLTGDDEKKAILLKYATRTVQEEWEGLDTYAAGNFEEWVEEIESLFPEIKSIKNGSLGRLTEICEEFRGLKKSDTGKVKRFGTSFKSEAAKLTRPPSLVTNPILVAKYISAFDSGFASEINQTITQHMYWKDQQAIAKPAPGVVAPAVQTGTTLAVPVVDRTEETIPLLDLLKMVESLTKFNAAAPTAIATLTAVKVDGTYETTLGIPPSNSKEISNLRTEVSERFDTFAGDIAQIRDNQALSEKRLTSSIIELKDSFKTSISQAIQSSVQNTGNRENNNNTGGQNSYRENQGSHRENQGSRENQGRYQPSESKDCYYCYLTGHMVRDCPYKKEHIDSGRILIENNRMKLGDGTAFPRWPENKSQKQRVDDYYQNKLVPGAPQVLIQTYTHPRIDQIAQYHSDIVDNLSSVYDSRDDEIRTLQVQKYIKDQLQRPDSQPVATFQQGQVLQNGGGTVQAYGPISQPMITKPMAPAIVNTAGFDINQLVQLIDVIRGSNQPGILPITQDQFALTRQSKKDGTSGSPNF